MTEKHIYYYKVIKVKIIIACTKKPINLLSRFQSTTCKINYIILNIDYRCHVIARAASLLFLLNGHKLVNFNWKSLITTNLLQSCNLINRPNQQMNVYYYIRTYRKKYQHVACFSGQIIIWIIKLGHRQNWLAIIDMSINWILHMKLSDIQKIHSRNTKELEINKTELG